MDNLIGFTGAFAAVLTTLAYGPQVKKAWPAGSTGDLSLKMLLALDTGLMLWVVYGLLKSDWIIAGSNVVGASLVSIVLGCKLRDIQPKAGT